MSRSGGSSRREHQEGPRRQSQRALQFDPLPFGFRHVMGAHVGDDAHGVPDGESRDDDGASRRGRRRRGWDDAGARESGRNRAHGARGEKCGEGGGWRREGRGRAGAAGMGRESTGMGRDSRVRECYRMNARDVTRIVRMARETARDSRREEKPSVGSARGATSARANDGRFERDVGASRVGVDRKSVV